MSQKDTYAEGQPVDPLVRMRKKAEFIYKDPKEAASERFLEEHKKLATELVKTDPASSKPKSEPVLLDVYERALPAVVKGSPPDFHAWTMGLKDADLDKMDKDIRCFLRVIKNDSSFPRPAFMAANVIVYLQERRVDPRVIEVALKAFKIYEKIKSF
jgi:hypothetical protein